MQLVEFVSLGGTIGWILVTMNVVGFALMIRKWLEIRRFQRDLRPALPAQIQARVAGSAARGTQLLEIARTEVVQSCAPLERGLAAIQTIATIAPLTGLLGTVVGIFNAFQIVSERGLDDPALFAGGIKLALVTTVIGLVVAIPHVVAYNAFATVIDAELNALENKVLLALGEREAPRA